MRGIIASVLQGFDLFILGYFLTLNSLYLLFSAVALVVAAPSPPAMDAAALDTVIRSPATPPISLIVPAYNEEATIAESLRVAAAAELSRSSRSSSSTTDRRIARSRLPSRRSAWCGRRWPTSGRSRPQPVRGVYRSLDHPRLVVIDKVNGGKADAINAGDQRRAAPAGLRHRRRLAARGARADAGGAAVHRGSRPRSRRRHHPHCQRVPVEDGRVIGRRPAGRAGWRVSRSSSTCARSSAGRVAHVGDERPADHLRRLRHVPARRRGRGRRLPHRHRRRGHGDRRPPAPRDARAARSRTASCSSRTRCAGPRCPSAARFAGAAAQPMAARARCRC